MFRLHAAVLCAAILLPAAAARAGEVSEVKTSRSATLGFAAKSGNSSLVDLKLGYRFNRYVKASVGVTDLFDEQPFYNYLMPGRRITGTVVLSY